MTHRALLVLLPLLLVLGDAQPAGAATLSIVDYGACTSCTSTANRTAIQAAINAASPGDTIFFPTGTWTINQASPATYGLIVNKSLTFRGQSRDGAVLAMDPLEADDLDTSWMVLWQDTSNVVIQDITFDGGKPNSNTVTFYDPLIEQHKGSFFDTVAGITITNARVRNFTGDGYTFYDGCTSILLQNSIIEYNQRNGLTVSPNIPTPIVGVRITGNTFQHNTVQPIDNEHGPVLDVEIDNNTMTSALGDYVLAMGGLDEQVIESANWYSDGWDVHHNVLNGGVTVVMGRNFVMRNNSGTNHTTKPNAEIRLSSENVTIEDNWMNFPNPVEASNAPVMIAGSVSTAPQWLPNTFYSLGSYAKNGESVYGAIVAGTSAASGGPTGTGQSIVDGTVTWRWMRDGSYAQDLRPKNIIIRRNQISVNHAQAYGVRAEGFVSVTVEDNLIANQVGAQQLNTAAVMVRATSMLLATESAIVRRNRLQDFGHKGIYVTGNGTAEMLYGDFSDNVIVNTAAGGAMTIGIDLDDGAKALKRVRASGNLFGCGVTSTMIDLPAGASFAGSTFQMRAACP